MPDISALQAAVAERFHAAFGRTPLPERIRDILNQATAVSRYTDHDHLRDEAGDLLAAVLQLCTECRWDPAEVVGDTLRKIQDRQEQYEKLGRKLSVALLGGAFDPVHNGHLEVAREVLRLGAADEVWLMPCYEHLAGKEMAAPEHRVEMCRLASRTVRGGGVFDYEVRHQFRGETYHLVKRLLTEEIARVRCEFSLVIGQDNADTFATWSNHEHLERMIRFIVLPRRGSPPPRTSAWYLKHPHVYLEDAKQEFPTSSTEVRRLLRAKDPAVENLVPAEVLTYIRAEKLYPAPVVPARRIAVYTGGFDPPTAFHRAVAAQLRDHGFDEVVVRPAGRREGKDGPEHAAAIHRAVMTDLAFAGLDHVRTDLTDLDDNTFTPPRKVEHQYAGQGEVWHVVPADFIDRGRHGQSIVQTIWDDGPAMWTKSRFVVVHPPGQEPEQADRPAACRLLAAEGHVPSADVRTMILHGGWDAANELLPRSVAEYGRRHCLFTATVPARETRFQLENPRVLIVHGPQPEAKKAAERFRRFEGPDPNLILVVGGDGTMLHAIRSHWRKRLPFLGLNAGHLGFLMNEMISEELDGADLVFYRMPMLRVDVTDPDGQTTTAVSYSDVWLERDGGQAAWLEVRVDGRVQVPTVVGDGLLVATPAGSSAYARAMGATPVPLNSPVLTVAGSNVFRPRFWKPVALPDHAHIQITSLEKSGRRPVRCFLDGFPVGRAQSIKVRVSSVASIELAFTPQFDLAERLMRSLFPPDEAFLKGGS